MTLQELLSIDIHKKQVLIIGMPAAGKTWLADKFDSTDLDVVHLDDYINMNEVTALHSIEEDIQMRLGKRFCITEGCFGYTLLLAGFKRKTYTPDIVIDISTSRAKQREVYLNERNPDKLKHLKRFHEMNLSLLNEWFSLISPTNRSPLYIQFENKF